MATDLYLNQSRISEVLDCEKKYYWGYEYNKDLKEGEGKGIRTRSEKLPLVTGRCYHTGIAHYYHHDRDIEGAIEAAKKEFNAIADKAQPVGDEIKLWNQDLMTLAVLLQGYHSRWKQEPLTVLAPEFTGQVKVGEVTVHGKVTVVWLVFRTDALVKEYNSVILLEHKTKGRTPSANEIAAINSALQPTAYCYSASKSTKMRVEGVKFRFAIKKPDYEVRRMHTEAFTSRTTADLKRFEEQTLWVAERIIERRSDGKWLNNWGHCFRYSECPYRRLCLYHGESSMFGMYAPRAADYVDTAPEGGLMKEGG